MRIALLTEIPTPFRIPLWNALAAIADVDLRVLLLRELDPRRTYELHKDEWRFDACVLGGVDRLVRGRWIVLNRRVGHELRRCGPEVIVVGGWNQPAYFQAALHARRKRAALVLWVESTARDERPGSLPLERLKRWMVAAANAFLVPGRASAAYLESFGVAPDRIAVAPNAVDERFAENVAAARAGRAEIRAELGLERCCFLYVGRLAREKGLDVLMRAFAGVPGELVVVGEGPQEHEVTKLAPPGVRLLGHVRHDDLPRWYAAADAFVLPSRSEPWGMVLNEAASAGLPLVATDAVGAAYDLIEPGINGLLVEAGDAAALREALLRLAADEAFRARAGARSRQLAEPATPQAWADAVAELARTLV